MKTKLTLHLESELIEAAKEQARQQGKSLSQLVADYLVTFPRMPEKQGAAPIMQSLKGLLKGSGLDEDDYKKHLEKKHSAESLRGFLQYDGEPISTEKLCQPVKYPDDFDRSE